MFAQFPAMKLPKYQSKVGALALNLRLNVDNLNIGHREKESENAALHKYLSIHIQNVAIREIQKKKKIDNPL